MSDWRDTAACLDEDPELFFPIGTTGPAVLQTQEAQAVCARCDVRSVCLEWALATGQEVGVWGGLTENERRALKRRNKRAGLPAATAPIPSPAGSVQCRRRYTKGGTLIDVADLRRALLRLELTSADLAKLSRRVNPDAPVDDTSFNDIRRGRRLRVYQGTYDRVRAVLDAAAALESAAVGS